MSRSIRVITVYFCFFLLMIFPCLAELKVVSPSQVFQGRSFIVFLASSISGEASAYFAGKKVAFFPYQDGLRAIVGCEPGKKPGNYILRIEASDGEVYETSIDLAPRVFPRVSFWLKPSKKKLLSPELIQKEWQKIEAELLLESGQKRWDGFFMKPVPGITTMAFGTREYINGRLSGRHRGQDFRARPGTSVRAANNGKVMVAQFFKTFGGTVVVDHGQGINTLYFHLSKISAGVGQNLKKGEILGLSGNTGISSGPHLHWAMSVHNVRVDPMQWVETVMP